MIHRVTFKDGKYSTERILVDPVTGNWTIIKYPQVTRDT